MTCCGMLGLKKRARTTRQAGRLKLCRGIQWVTAGIFESPLSEIPKDEHQKIASRKLRHFPRGSRVKNAPFPFPFFQLLITTFFPPFNWDRVFSKNHLSEGVQYIQFRHIWLGRYTHAHTHTCTLAHSHTRTHALTETPPHGRLAGPRGHRPGFAVSQ